MEEIVFVATDPFGNIDPTFREKLKPYETHYNKTGREYPKIELIENLKRINPHYIIAGVEKYDAEALDCAPNLKLISRVGIGLDSVDLEECKKRGITVTYTPDAPSNAVAEMTIGQIIMGIRFISLADHEIRKDGWNRHIGKEIEDCKFGLIGFGRIGKLVHNKLKALGAKDILIYDIDESQLEGYDISNSSKEEIIKSCDIVSLHIPFCKENINHIAKEELQQMKTDAILINNSRGRIVNEDDLYAWLNTNERAFAALDTFAKEPYRGPLANLNNMLFTAHMGSCSTRSRNDMEGGALQEVLNMILGKEFNNKII